MQAIVNFNEEHHGIELSFPDKPSEDILAQLKGNGFRWHHVKKVWFAKQSDPRMALVNSLCGKEVTKNPAPTSRQEKNVEENVFAAVYDKIGNDRIVRGDELVSLFSGAGAYVQKEKFHFRRSQDGNYLTLTDLEQAGKSGKKCTVWQVTCDQLQRNQMADRILYNELHIESAQELYAALQSGRELSSLRVSRSEEKGVEVFSPFLSVKSLIEIPDKWVRRNFIQALQSGQIYEGQIDSRYTDDYACDAAENYSEGAPINLAVAAREAVEHWYKTAYITTDRKTYKNGKVEISYSDGAGTSKSFFFDLHCDLHEAKRRGGEKSAGIRQFNTMMESACISLPPEQVEDAKIYQLNFLEKNTNTGVCETRSDLLQGAELKERLSFLSILSASPLAIEPDRLYSVSDFNDRQENVDDPRIINCGNWQEIVTGKALVELTQEGVIFPNIRPASGEFANYDQARQTLLGLANGNMQLFFSPQKCDYKKSVIGLESEHRRSMEPQTRTLQHLIENASQRLTDTQLAPQRNCSRANSEERS